MNGNVVESSVSVFASQLASPQPRVASHLWSRQSSGSSGCSGWLHPVPASPQERFLGTSAGGTLGTSTTCRWFWHLGCSGSLLHLQILRRLVLHFNDHADNLLLVQELQELQLRNLHDLQHLLHRKTESPLVARLTCPSLSVIGI